MASFVYEQFPPGGRVTLSFNDANGRIQSVTIVNPGTMTWRGGVADPASRQPDGSYATWYETTCLPGETRTETGLQGAIRLRAVTVDVDGEAMTDFEVYNTATKAWERPVAYRSGMGA